jgi:hypothetical protein
VIKHRSIGNLFARNFRLTSFLYFYENIVLNILLTLVFWVTLAFLLLTADITSLANATLLALLLYTGFTLIQSLVILFYSNNWKRDLPVLAVFPFYMFYAIFLRAARMFALYDEIVNKGSYKDQYVPAYVQRKLLS